MSCSSLPLPFLSTSGTSISTPTLTFCNVFQPQKVLQNLYTCKTITSSLQLSFQPHQYVDNDDEEHVLGDCLVFEEGIFDAPHLHQTLTPTQSQPQQTSLSETTHKTKTNEVKPENLIPDNWVEVQKEINITKKERRKLAQEEQFGSRVEKRRLEMMPIERNVGVKDYVKYMEEKLKPVVLDTPVFREGARESEKELEERPKSSGRVAPRNPKWAVYGGLDDITEFFNTTTYDPNAVNKPQGSRKLFSKEEKLLLNRRIPDLAVATSGKWKPFHTLAASGEFYLATSLLKHNIDINIRDKNGLTAIHKAILGKKQAIFNFLLRESANPFIRDTEGATLMHYAVIVASCQMIKILLLYNVDINQQDDAGWTPLHLAVQSRRTDVVRLLLIKGADGTLRNQDGLTPLEICLHSGHNTRTYEIIKLLKQLPKTRVI